MTDVALTPLERALDLKDFLKWLKTQEYKQSPIGDLARDVASDVGSRKKGDRLTTMSQLEESVKAANCKESLEVFVRTVRVFHKIKTGVDEYKRNWAVATERDLNEHRKKLANKTVQEAALNDNTWCSRCQKRFAVGVVGEPPTGDLRAMITHVNAKKRVVYRVLADSFICPECAKSMIEWWKNKPEKKG